MDPSDKQRTRLGLADILGKSEYMARLIGDLLTLARLGQGDGLLNMELFELAESIDAILPRARTLVATKNIEVEYILTIMFFPSLETELRWSVSSWFRR